MSGRAARARHRAGAGRLRLRPDGRRRGVVPQLPGAGVRRSAAPAGAGRASSTDCCPSLLERLARRRRTATFFVLGEVAERLPERVREIAAAGHEVASHGFLHRRASTLPLGELRADAARAKALLEDLLGTPVARISLARVVAAPSPASIADPSVAEARLSPTTARSPRWPGAGRRSNPPSRGAPALERRRRVDRSAAADLRRPPAASGRRLGREAGAAGVARSQPRLAIVRQGGLPVVDGPPVGAGGAPDPGRASPAWRASSTRPAAPGFRGRASTSCSARCRGPRSARL